MPSGVETLQGLLSLPDWVGRVTIGALGIGLVVVGASAWIRSLESTTAAEDAGELPRDWEIAPSHALASLRDGRMPHLNWGRVVLGNVVSLSLTIGVAGAIAIMRTGTAPSVSGGFGVEASEAPSGIAVLPFTVQGPGLDLYREAMVSFVSTNIDGVVGFRSINPRSVHAACREAFGD